ncbi:CLUMA_CG001115, isoform A [Clunio marinus]|uniref:CLUMA_CG001115, isoform A n=1 Tax=Clunio marinus TaxID=568069 RepID=A0A1J1HM62_9DIPT|nr:CLUMA_CG001115, isoform A [Clunio marinus]
MLEPERKRKRVVLTLEEKLEVVNYRDQGLSVESIAEKFNIGISTVSEIVKRRDLIEQAVNNRIGATSKRKTMRAPKKHDVETELYNWYLKQKQTHQPIQTQDLFEEATRINSRLYDEDDWLPTNGWLSRFKERYGIGKISLKSDKPEKKRWDDALDAAEYLLDYMNTRDFVLKDIITVRMIRDRIANRDDREIEEF